MAMIEVNIVLPEEVLSFTRLSKEEVGEEMRRLLLLELVRESKISYGKAAALLGIGQAEFLQYMARHKVSLFQFTPEELDEELRPIE